MFPLSPIMNFFNTKLLIHYNTNIKYQKIQINYTVYLQFIDLLFININSIVHPIDQGWPTSQSRSTG